jgi:capsular exopolysaccharide synthesis family protein
MSRIFDALRRAGVEQTGVAYPDVRSLATEVFGATMAPAPAEPETSNETLEELPLPVAIAEHRTLMQEAVAAASANSAGTAVSPLQEFEREEATHAVNAFPMLQISVPASSRVVVLSDPETLAAEKFRFVAVRLRQMRQARRLKKVVITSMIPEEGKSLVSSNLAAALAQKQERVLLIDGDLRRPTQANVFGIGRVAGLSEWLESGPAAVSNIYQMNPAGFWMMPAGIPAARSLELLQSPRLPELMKRLETMFDWIIVDSPPLLPLADTTVWTRCTDGTLLVTREGKTEKAHLNEGLEMLKNSNLLGVVINGCTRHEQKYYYQYYSAKGTK